MNIPTPHFLSCHPQPSSEIDPPAPSVRGPLTRLVLRSPFGDKPLKLYVVCPKKKRGCMPVRQQ